MNCIFSWTLVAAWAGIIFYLSGLPNLNSGLGVWDFVLRKFVHVFEFGILTMLLWRAIRVTWTSVSRNRLALIAFAAAFLYAVSDEVHQAFVPGRGPSAVDVMVDAVGIVLATVWLRWSTSRTKEMVA